MVITTCFNKEFQKRTCIRGINLQKRKGVKIWKNIPLPASKFASYFGNYNSCFILAMNITFFFSTIPENCFANYMDCTQCPLPGCSQDARTNLLGDPLHILNLNYCSGPSPLLLATILQGKLLSRWKVFQLIFLSPPS